MESAVALKLLLAALLGGCIGIEREMRDKPAGLRTNILICVGSTLFILVSIHLAERSGGDATRIAAQIISGIGFLGAGAVLHSHGFVLGLTTAATIWVVAGVGMALGIPTILRNASTSFSGLNFRRTSEGFRLWFNLAVSRETNLKIIEGLSGISEIRQVESGDSAHDLTNPARQAGE